MRDILNIVIHSADTPANKYFDINDIRKWHVEENGWSDVGYHYVILLNGTIQLGRPLNVAGAHVSGHNSKSIGICYIGGGGGIDTRTLEQKESLHYLLTTLKMTFKDAEILGHRDFNEVHKACPCFDAKKEYKYINYG